MESAFYIHQCAYVFVLLFVLLFMLLGIWLFESFFPPFNYYYSSHPLALHNRMAPIKECQGEPINSHHSHIASKTNSNFHLINSPLRLHPIKTVRDPSVN